MAVFDALPEPRTLPQENTWIELLGPASQRTAPTGDWNVFPHMQSKDSWKERMGKRAELVDSFLQRWSVSVDGCMLCKDHGVGHPGNWSGHIASQRHFKIFGQKICTDDVTGRSKDIDMVRDMAWEMWLIPGGSVGFNHADGRIVMYKGQSPPPLKRSCQPAMHTEVNNFGYASAPQPALGSTFNGPTPMIGGGNGFAQNPGANFPPPNQAVTPWSGGPPQTTGFTGHVSTMIESCPQDNCWYKFWKPVGMPHQKDGDYNSCPWLTSKNCWKAAMADRANVIREILTHFQIYPPCPYCPQAGDFPGHLPAQKHYQALCAAKLIPGKKIIDISRECYQQWRVPGGMIRFNHVSGEITACRGTPQSERALDLTPLALTGMDTNSQCGAPSQATMPTSQPAAFGPGPPRMEALPGMEASSQFGAPSQTTMPTSQPAAFGPGAPRMEALPGMEANSQFGAPSQTTMPTSQPAAFDPGAPPPQQFHQAPDPGVQQPCGYLNGQPYPHAVGGPPQAQPTFGQPAYGQPQEETWPTTSWMHGEAAWAQTSTDAYQATPPPWQVDGGPAGSPQSHGPPPHLAAAKEQGQDQHFEWMFWMFEKKILAHDRQAAALHLSRLSELKPDQSELECLPCGDEFRSISELQEHFSSPGHFRKLLQLAGWPKKKPKDPCWTQQFCHGRFMLDHWTQMLTEVPMHPSFPGGAAPAGMPAP